MIYGLFAAVGLLSTALLYAEGEPVATALAAGLTLLVLYLLRRSFKRRSGVTAQPQFTRQNLRARQEEAGADSGDGTMSIGEGSDATVESRASPSSHGTPGGSEDEN
jgi:membrane protein implicated in regulation of membrane protease activity